MAKCKMPPNGFEPPPPARAKWFCAESDYVDHLELEDGFAEHEELRSWLDPVRRGFWVSVLLLVALVGCGGYEQEPLDETAEREEIADAALVAWQRLVPYIPDCEKQREGIAWSESPEAFVGTHADSDGIAEVAPGSAPVIHIRPGVVRTVERYQELVAHELSHWLQTCSCRWEDGDPEHADSEVWPAMVEAIVAERNMQ